MEVCTVDKNKQFFLFGFIIQIHPHLKKNNFLISPKIISLLDPWISNLNEATIAIICRQEPCLRWARYAALLPLLLLLQLLL